MRRATFSSHLPDAPSYDGAEHLPSSMSLEGQHLYPSQAPSWQNQPSSFPFELAPLPRSDWDPQPAPSVFHSYPSPYGFQHEFTEINPPSSSQHFEYRHHFYEQTSPNLSPEPKGSDNYGEQFINLPDYRNMMNPGFGSTDQTQSHLVSSYDGGPGSSTSTYSQMPVMREQWDQVPFDKRNTVQHHGHGNPSWLGSNTDQSQMLPSENIAQTSDSQVPGTTGHGGYDMTMQNPTVYHDPISLYGQILSGGNTNWVAPTSNAPSPPLDSVDDFPRKPHKGTDNLLTWKWRKGFTKEQRKKTAQRVQFMATQKRRQQLTPLGRHFCLQSLKRNANPSLIDQLFHPETRRTAFEDLVAVPGTKFSTKEMRNHFRDRLEKLQPTDTSGDSQRNYQKASNILRRAEAAHFLFKEHLYSRYHEISEDAYQRFVRYDRTPGPEFGRQIGPRPLKFLFKQNVDLRDKVIKNLKTAWHFDGPTTTTHLRKKMVENPEVAKQLLNDETFTGAAATLAPQIDDMPYTHSDDECEEE